MCGTQKATNAASAQQSSFTNNVIAQGQQVFGNDSTVFNDMISAYSNILAAGPSQQGFGAGEQNALNSAELSNVASQYKNVAGATKENQAAFGGGNTVTTSGQTQNTNTGIAEAAANSAATGLNQIQQANWAQGNANWKAAGAGMQAAPGVFNNMTGFNQSAQSGLNANMANAQAADAAKNWWVKPVMGALGAGLNMVTSGLGSGNGENTNNNTNNGGGGGAGSMSPLQSMFSNAGNGGSTGSFLGNTNGNSLPMGAPLAPTNNTPTNDTGGSGSGGFDSDSGNVSSEIWPSGGF